MDGYVNVAKNPTDWPWSFCRSTGDLVILAPSHSQLTCTYDLIDAIAEKDPLKFEEFSGDLASFALVRKQWQENAGMRENAAKTLNNMLAKVFDACSVHIVGSWASGGGAESSDLDTTLVVKGENGAFNANKSFMIATLSRVHSLFVSAEADRITDIEFVEQAQIPHLLFTMRKGKHLFRIRMNVNQLYDIISSHLLYHYAKLDKRFAALCVLVKAYAEAKQVSRTTDGSFSGYTLNLLVLHYLMCATVPAVLPNLQQKYGGFFNATNAIRLVKELPLPMVRNEQKKWKKKDAKQSEPDPPATTTKKREVDTKSIGYLLMGFFDYYSHFDFANRAVCIAHGCCVARESLPDMSSRDPTIVMDPYEPLNVARNVNLESFTTIIGVLRETREALFSPLKTPSIGDIGQKVSDEERNVARQLKKREDRQMKAAVNARSNKVSQQAAAAKTQKYSKKMDKQEEANREFTSPAAYGEIAKVEAALCQADQRRREADHALLTSLSRQQRTTTAETEKPAWSDPNFLSDL